MKDNDEARKIKYKGCEYEVEKADKIKFERLRLLLALKRIKRRICIAFPKRIWLYVVLVVFWGCFFVLTYLLGNTYKAPLTFTWMDAFWDIKNPFFTTVILAAVLDALSQMDNYKKTLEEQHKLYIEILDISDNLLAPLLDEEIWYYKPFYSNKCVEDTIAYLGRLDPEMNCPSSAQIKKSLNDILNKLNEIQGIKSTGRLISPQNHLGYTIPIAREMIESMLCKDEITVGEIKQLVGTLHCVIADVRKPWRRDWKIDVEMLGILAKYNKDISDSFHYRMLVFGYEFGHKENLLDVEE